MRKSPALLSFFDRLIRLPGIQELTYRCLAGCTSLETLELSDTLYMIDQQAFSDCSSLRRIELPTAVENIYNKAFSGCSGLKEIVFTGNVPYISDDAFHNVTATAYYPDGNDTWTKDIMLDYGGDLTWKPLDEAPAITYGDLNGDGNINTLDLVMLRKELNGDDPDIVAEAADVNGDGNINTLDLIVLRKYLNGDDVELGG